MFCPRWEEEADCTECNYDKDQPDVCCHCGGLMWEYHVPRSGGVVNRRCEKCDPCLNCTNLKALLEEAEKLCISLEEARENIGSLGTLAFANSYMLSTYLLPRIQEAIK